MQAMESRVETLILGLWGRTTINMAALTKYSGHGKCENLKCYYDWRRYGKKLRAWGESKTSEESGSRTWKVSGHDGCVNMERKLVK